jgi:hypothetical protein
MCASLCRSIVHNLCIGQSEEPFEINLLTNLFDVLESQWRWYC